MIYAIEVAARGDGRLREIWDQIAMGLVESITKAIRRDQKAGLIGPMNAKEISVALNQFNLTYLNSAFGQGRKKSEREAFAVLERVWLGTLYGSIGEER